MKNPALDKAKEELEQASAAVNDLMSQTLSTEAQSTAKINALFGARGDTSQQLETLRQVVINLSDRIAALEAKK